ncbi:MAG: hypothetical protein P1U39_00490 [Legionellaceae bacterium]|nr:hypothetical protein [Legionellaceae bacterium]
MIKLDPDHDSPESLELYADHEGTKHIQKILTSVENEPWSLTLFQLAWTAGPLTFIALQGGYLIGYGSFAPLNLFVYFAGYTALTGLLGFVIKAFYNAHHKTKSEQTKQNYMASIDLLFRLMRSIPDYRLSVLSKSERKAESSSILLSNTHALPASVALGVNELTKNKDLIELSQKIELFRRSGLFSRVNDLIENSDVLQHEHTLQLINTPNDAGYYLKMRLQGSAPTLQEGRAREDGFLQRINQASEYNQPSMMHLKDAEEFLILLYELLNGRKITFLNFSYMSHTKLRHKARALEKSRATFRLSRASLLSKIDDLYSKLITEGLITDVKDYDTRVKCEQIFASLNQDATQLLMDSKHEGSAVVKNKRAKFADRVNAYTKIQKLYKETVMHQKNLEHAVENWQALSKRYNKKKTRFRYGFEKKGLRITEKDIFFDDETKLACTNAIIDLLKEYGENQLSSTGMSGENIKQLIIHLSRKIDEFVNITNPIHQYGIESSNATNFGSLDLDSSIEARSLWSASLAAETTHKLNQAAEKLAKVLVYEYDEMLDENAMIFLQDKYNANPAILSKLMEDKIHATYRPVYHIPVQLHEKPQTWVHVLRKQRLQRIDSLKETSRGYAS